MSQELNRECRCCKKLFVQPKKGRNMLYCSRACGCKWWSQNNKDRHRAIQKKSQGAPENRERQRDTRYKRNYGLSLTEVSRMLTRQFGKCLGCQKPISLSGGSCHVDHDHKTNAVRGLLCSLCNQALGLVKESPETLRRLSSYLHYDRTRLGVYVVGSLRNPKVLEVGNALRAAGIDAMDDWYGSGEKADDAWQAYEQSRGRSYTEALKGRAAESIYCFDRSLLDLADAAVLVAPGGRSAFLELGYIVGCGKPAYIFDDGDATRRFEVMPNFATAVMTDLDLLIARLKGLAESVL